MFDYRGYGKSYGSIGKENDIYMDGEAAYQYILSRGTKPENIIIWGQSLGGAVAIHTAQ
jgi:alpha-beta hydrolase superfamily lysophospholipase